MTATLHTERQGREKKVKRESQFTERSDLDFFFFFLPINFGLSRKEVGGAGIRCAWLEALVPVQWTGVHLPTRIQSFVWTSCLSPPHVARKSLGPTTILSLSLSELHLFIFSHTLASLFLSLIEYLFVEGLKQPQIT